MDKSYKIKCGLNKAGREVFLADSDWRSTPFRAVLVPKWKNTKTQFEMVQTGIGMVAADYFTYIGPYDHDIEALSDNAFLYSNGGKYVFRKKERVIADGKTQFFWGILRKVNVADYD